MENEPEKRFFTFHQLPDAEKIAEGGICGDTPAATKKLAAEQLAEIIALPETAAVCDYGHMVGVEHETVMQHRIGSFAQN
ncbi:hypothetical protein, partial [uncultured Victivallis sp.]|uniref:hypothetical protein n=1 Tax=uncultured Victivallis sp. TaxID=354118 RepID=UPI0025896BD2